MIGCDRVKKKDASILLTKTNTIPTTYIHIKSEIERHILLKLNE